MVASRLEHDGVVIVIAACCGAAGDSVLATTVRRSGVQRQVSALDRVAVPLARLTTPIGTSLRPIRSLSLTRAPIGPVTATLL